MAGDLIRLASLGTFPKGEGFGKPVSPPNQNFPVLPQ